MKTNTLLLGLILCLLTHMATAQNPDKAKIIIYRENSYVGSGVSYRIQANDSLIVRMKNNAMYSIELTPGPYDFMVERHPNTLLSLELEANQTYYLRLGLRTNMWSTLPELLLVDERSATPALASASMRILTPEKSRGQTGPNRLGICFGSGWGFHNTTMFTTTDNRNSKISTGGGFYIGAHFATVLTPDFEIAFDLAYQNSGLRPHLNNASMDFSRGLIGVTPALIVPLRPNRDICLNLGAGIDYIFSPTMDIESAKISNGFNDKWKYENIVSFKLQGLVSFNLSETWSMLYGLKYYHANYTFQSGGYTYPIGSEFNKPKGSGIDLLLGMAFHF